MNSIRFSMKFDSLKSHKKNSTKTQSYTILIISIAILTVARLIFFENNINTIFAQSSVTTTNTNMTKENQQIPSSPQLNIIIREQGKITNQRVLEVHPHPKIESTFVANVTILGNILAHDLGTYWATVYPNGSVHGEGHGLTTI